MSLQREITASNGMARGRREGVAAGECRTSADEGRPSVEVMLLWRWHMAASHGWRNAFCISRHQRLMASWRHRLKAALEKASSRQQQRASSRVSRLSRAPIVIKIKASISPPAFKPLCVYEKRRRHRSRIIASSWQRSIRWRQRDKYIGAGGIYHPHSCLLSWHARGRKA